MRKIGRWVSLAAGLYLMLAGGHPYAIGTYASALKQSLGYTQYQLNFVTSFGNVGMYIGAAGGWVCDKFGPKVTVWGGAAFAIVGYSTLWLVITGKTGLPSSHVLLTPPIVGFLFAFTWQSGPWLDCSVVSSNLKNFPADRGSVTGLLKAFFGLSGSVIAQVYILFFAARSTPEAKLDVLLLIGGAVAGIVILVSPFIWETREPLPALNQRGRMRLQSAYLLVFGLCGLLAGLTSVRLPAFVHNVPALPLVLVCLVLALFVALPLGAGDDEHMIQHHPPMLIPTDNSISTPLLDPEEADDLQTRQPCMAECTPSEMMAQLDFWLVMLAFSIGTGVGLMCINNCAQIAEAKGEIHPQKFVTLVSVANTSGRMLGGTLSDIFQNHCPRPLCLALSLLLMGASQVALGLHGDFICTGFVFMGTAYGAMWGVIPSLASELFGFTNLAMNYSMLTCGPALSGLALSAGLASHFYDRYADPLSQVCHGPQCYGPTQQICTGLCVLGTVVLVLVCFRKRAYYSLPTSSSSRSSQM